MIKERLLCSTSAGRIGKPSQLLLVARPLLYMLGYYMQCSWWVWATLILLLKPFELPFRRCRTFRVICRYPIRIFSTTIMLNGARGVPTVRDQRTFLDPVDQASMFNPTDLLYQISCLGMTLVCILALPLGSVPWQSACS